MVMVHMKHWGYLSWLQNRIFMYLYYRHTQRTTSSLLIVLFLVRSTKRTTQLAPISCHRIHVTSLKTGFSPKCLFVLRRQRLQRKTFRVALGIVVFFLWIPNAIPESAFLPSSAFDSARSSSSELEKTQPETPSPESH